MWQKIQNISNELHMRPNSMFFKAFHTFSVMVNNTQEQLPVLV